MTILRKYKSDFGQWYAQTDTTSGRVELSFDHDPSDAEVQAIVDSMVVVEIVELVAENGQII